MFGSGRKRLRIYLSTKEQGVQEWKEQAVDLSEYQGTGCSGVERKRLRIYLKHDKEQDIQEWKEQVVDPMSGRNRLGFI
jgi:hypothetical protein